MSPCAVGRCVRGCMVRMGLSMCCGEMCKGMHGEDGCLHVLWGDVLGDAR